VTEGFHGFPQSFQANSAMVSQIMPRPLPSTYFHSSFINHPELLTLERMVLELSNSRLTTSKPAAGADTALTLYCPVQETQAVRWATPGSKMSTRLN
jgi:hypothetical protein